MKTDPATDSDIPDDMEIIDNSPRPICILRTGDDHKFELDIDAVEEILLRDNLRDKKVVVVSVAGAFRKGKSFLLDFFLRYLQRKGIDDWMGGEEDELTGFSWRGGSERETTGILLWSEPFVVDLPSGEQVAVLIMDTQGAFDSQATVKECATVFALSTMMSSVQVFNLSQNIQEDNLQHLQLFTEYGRLAKEESNEAPFQRLEFLVRDWSSPDDFNYGDGQEFLNKRLQVSDSLHEELRNVRGHIKQCFEKVGCFLMPHPGKVVSTSRTRQGEPFTGKLKHIDEEFLEFLGLLAPRLLAPKNLLVKNINGHDVTCLELLEYFKCYIKIFASEELPEPKSMLQATAEANNLAALASSKDQYQKDMDKLCGGDTPYLKPSELENRSEIYKNKSVTLFRSTRKMGGDEICQQYEDQLVGDIDRIFENFVKVNANKNVFNAARTPAVFTLIMVTSYLMSGIFGMVGVSSIATIFNFLLGVALLATITWAYIRFSGELREIGTQLDSAAEWVWDELIVVGYEMALQKSTDALIQRQVSGIRTTRDHQD